MGRAGADAREGRVTHGSVLAAAVRAADQQGVRLCPKHPAVYDNRPRRGAAVSYISFVNVALAKSIPVMVVAPATSTTGAALLDPGIFKVFLTKRWSCANSPAVKPPGSFQIICWFRFEKVLSVPCEAYAPALRRLSPIQ